MGLGSEGVGPEGVRALVASGLLAQLEGLRLERLPLGDEGLLPLIAALPDDRLRRLELIHVFAQDATALALSRARVLARVEVLDLSANRIGPAGAATLAGAITSGLRELDLSGRAGNPCYGGGFAQPIGDVGAAAWAHSNRASGLRTLRLASTHISDVALEALASAKHACHLETLDLATNAFTHRGVAALSASSLMQTLRALERLDALFTGCVDEYHGAGYSTLFTAAGTAALCGARHLRPEVLAGWQTEAFAFDLDAVDDGRDRAVAAAAPPEEEATPVDPAEAAEAAEAKAFFERLNAGHDFRHRTSAPDHDLATE